MTRADRLRRLKSIRKWIAGERSDLRKVLRGDRTHPVFVKCSHALKSVDELILAEMAAGLEAERAA
jgi:hypothetical protein